MKLVPQTSPLVASSSSMSTSPWIPFLEDPSRECYSYLLPFGVQEQQQQQQQQDQQNSSCHWTNQSQLDEWFDRLHPSRYSSNDSSGDGDGNSNNNNNAWTDAYYKGELLLRKTAWMTLDDACQCEYGYSDTWQHQATSTEFLRVIKEITQSVIQATGCTSLNSCNLNYYPQGGGVGWHADDEFLFDGIRQPTCIISLSLCRGDSSSSGGDGGARKFMIRLQQDKQTEEDVQDQYDNDDSTETTIQSIVLRHGDLITMEGRFQKYYFHSIWPGDSKQYADTAGAGAVPGTAAGAAGHEFITQGERINLTWRTIVQHLDGSQEECRGKICPLSTLPKKTTKG